MNALEVSRFNAATAAAAAGVSLGSLLTWIKRGDLPGAQGEIGVGTGHARQFSARRVLHLAVIGDLVRVGLPVRLASRLALAFTDYGGAESDVGGALLGDTSPPVRALGDVYPGGTVFRVLFPRDGGEPVTSIERPDSIAGNPFIHGSTAFRTVLLIDLNDLRSRVLAALGIDQ